MKNSNRKYNLKTATQRHLSNRKRTLLERKVRQMQVELYNQCCLKSSEKPEVGTKVPGNQFILSMAIKVISELESEEKMLVKEKKNLCQNQRVLLDKLILMLKGINSSEKSPKLSSDESDQQIVNVKSKGKNYFLGFRSKNPVLRDRYGLITIDKVFGSSPPPSPIRETCPETLIEEDFPPPLPATAENLNFVFKPNFDLCERNDNFSAGGVGPSFSDDGVLNEASNSQKNLVTANSSEQHEINTKDTIMKCACNYQTSDDQYISGKVNSLLSGRGKTLESETLNSPQILKSKRGRTIKLKKWNDSYLKSIQIISKKRKLKMKSMRNGKVNKSERVITQTPSLKAKLPRKNNLTNALNRIREVNSLYSSKESNNVNNIFDINSHNPFHGFFTHPEGTRTGLQDVLSQNNFVKRKLPSSLEANKETHPPVNKQTFTNSSEFLNHKRVQRVKPVIKGSEILENSDPESHSEGASTNSLTDKNTLPNCAKYNQESELLYYPVHPFISHDLPVHFIPIDAKNIPDFLPLYTPIIGAKSNAPIYPSFVRTRLSNEKTSPTKYVVSKGINSKSIPRRSYPIEEVHRKILPGVAPTTHCSLIPKVIPRKSSTVESEVVKGKQNTFSHVRSLHNSPPSSSDSRSSDITNYSHPRQSSHSPSLRAGPQSNGYIISPMTGINQQRSKIHKCSKCSFITPKLGVLKRHELSHTRTSNTNEEVLVLDSKIQSSVSVTTVKRPSTRRSNSNSGEGSGINTNNISPVKTGDEVRIVEASSLKNCSDQENSFGGFTDTLRKNSLLSRFPNVTFTPVYNNY